MPARVLGAVFLFATTMALAEGPAWRNSLKPRGAAAAEMIVVSEGQPRYAIVVPVQATARERKAADELRYWINEITGVSLAVATSAPAGPLIRVAADPQLAEEQYRIAVDEAGNLELRGGAGRGLMHAVFALLEEDIGCRWFTRTDARLPRSPTLRVAPVPRTDAPRLRLREPYYACAFDPAWSLRNRTNAPNAAVPEEAGGHIDYGGLFVHTHAALMPPGEHFAKHPEWFALNAGGQRYTAQVCATHPEVARIIAENVLAALKKHPHAELISVSKNDNAGDQICHCPECAALRQAEGGSDMGPQLVLVNRVAETIEKTHPHVVIDTLAYLETSGVPKTLRPRKNVAVRFCNDTVGAWAQPFTPAEKCKAAALARAWSAVHDRIHVWDYNVNFSHYLAPMPNLEVIAANIRFWTANKAEGVMLQGGYQGPAERDELKSWVGAKLLWDPSRNERDLAEDFHLGHYGAAAPALIDYERLLAETAQQHAAVLAAPPHGIRYPMDAAFLSKEFLDRATQLFAHAHELAAGDAATVQKIERAELPILYVKAARGRAFVGDEYAAVLDRFERIARREGVRCLAEGPADFDAKLAAWRKP